MAGRGYIKMHREVMEHPVFAHDGLFRLFSFLLFKANWKESVWLIPGTTESVKVKRGQLVTGRESLTVSLYPSSGPSSRTVWRMVEALRELGCIETKNMSSRCTLITICNYETYQNDDSEPCPGDVQVVSRLCPAGVQVVSTSKETKKPRKEEVCVAGESLVAAWNSTEGAAPVRKMNAKRMAIIKTRLSDPEWDWRSALAKFPLRCFADNPGGYVPTLDFFLRPDTVNAILEGKYDWSKNAKPEQPPSLYPEMDPIR